MTRWRRRMGAGALVLAAVLATPVPALSNQKGHRPVPAPAKAKKPAPAPASSNYDELYQRYLSLARTMPPPAGTPWVNTLFIDTRARGLNDLVTVRVAETLSASGSAESNLDKDTQTGVSLSKLFGLETKYSGFLDPSSLAALSAQSAFKGSGATTRQGLLTATITARVAEVLPNGDLAIEGIRELDINGDRQMLVLTGVVRPFDVGPGNVVESTAIGQMRIRYFGQGLMRDNLRPGWLARVLNRIF